MVSESRQKHCGKCLRTITTQSGKFPYYVQILTWVRERLRNPKDNDFLKELKTACAEIGLNPALFGTHSLRRGNFTDQFANGVPDKVIKYSGRWRSNAFEAYIDHTVPFELQLQTIQPPK